MPNNIIITPGSASIQFSGSANNDTIRLQVEASGGVAFYGNSGSLFSITDQLSGSLMSVNDISGLPILEVFSDDRVVMGTLNQNTLVVTGSRVGIGMARPTTPLQVQGVVSASAFSGSLIGTASFATTASAATSITFTPATASFATSASFAPLTLPSGLVSSSLQINTGSFSGSFTGTLIGTSSWASNVISASFATSASYTPPSFIDNYVTVGLAGSNTNYTSIKAAVDSITDASAANTYTVRVYPGVYIEDTITLKPYIAIKGDSSISTVVSASNPANTIFVMADQTMVIDMQIQGSTAANTSAVVYSSPTTPQTNAIAYVENVRFGTNYTNAKVVGSGSSGNCILQCSNVKYGGFTSGSKSFDVGFYVTSGSDGGIGRMQLRNVTSTNGGVAGTDNDQIFALADAPGCTFIVNGCLLTRATGAARGTGFKVYNGGQLRLTGVNFQRWIRGIWAPQTGSAPSIDAIALNFENCTTDVAIEHTGSLGKVQGTDNFLKTQIALNAPLYEVGQDPRKITVAKKGGDFTSISASVAYITDSSENNRYIIEVGPGQFTESEIDLTNKPYVSIFGSDIQATEVIASGSNHNIFKLGNTSEVSFMTLRGSGVGCAAFDATDLDGFALVHKISIYDCDYGVKVIGNTAATSFFGEYVDMNGTFSYGTYVSSSNGTVVDANMENYYLFPSASAVIGNYIAGPSASLSLYAAKYQGDGTANSTAIRMENGAVLEAAAVDIQNPDYGLVIPAGGNGPEFRIVGGMIHDTGTYDFDVQNSSTRGRYQGVSNHTKINNNSENFYWNFLDDEDGENDVTRKLSVTFADGTHTDATTLIFKGSPMGVMQGGTITTGSGFGITAASGFGYLQDTIDTDVYKRLDWVDGTLTLTANSNNYIYITDAGTLTSAGTIPDNETNIILGRVVTNDTKVEFIDQTLYNGEHMANKLSTFNRKALGPVFAAGSTVTQNVTPFKLDVTQGTYFFSENEFTPIGTSSINLTQYYPSASAWARYTSSIVPNNVYASSSALVAMSASAYTKHTVYLVGDGADEKYFLILNSNQYSTLVEAENANLPSIPSYFNDGVVPLAAVYVQSGSANITQIQDIRPIIGFRATGVNASSVHGNLLGLDADDHTQYLLVNGARAMAGTLSLGGNDITNVGTMFGTASWATNAVNAITASAANSITFTPATASFAPTSSLTISASFATSSSRAVTSSFSISSSFTTNAVSSSYPLQVVNSSLVSFEVSRSGVIPTGSVILGANAAGLLTNNPNGIIVIGSHSLFSSSLTNSTNSGVYIGAGTAARGGTFFSDVIIGPLASANSNVGAGQVVAIGLSANANTTGSGNTVSIGSRPGVFSKYVDYAISIGEYAGSNVQRATYAINIGYYAGEFGNSGSRRIAIGEYAGAYTDLSEYSVNIGTLAGLGVSSSAGSINIGRDAGRFTGNATNNSKSINYSTNIGHGAGKNASTPFSINIGVSAGQPTSSILTGSNTIVIGNGIAVPNNSTNFMNLGGLLFATGIHSSSDFVNSPTTVTSSLSAQAKVGILTPTPQYTLDVSGSGNFTNGLTVTGSLIATASWASNSVSSSFATSASWAPSIGGVTSIVAGNGLTGGTINSTGTITLDTSSVHFLDGVKKELNTEGVVSSSTQISYTQLQNIPANIVSSSAQVIAFLPVGTVSSSLQISTGSFTGSFSGSLLGSSSFATTSSFASNVLRSKAGNVTNTSFAGNPRKATVTFTTAFPNTNYAITVTGEDARSWTIESKLAGSFVINANSNTGLAGTTYWIATAYGEN